jgi:hypothetical protein
VASSGAFLGLSALDQVAGHGREGEAQLLPQPDSLNGFLLDGVVEPVHLDLEQDADVISSEQVEISQHFSPLIVRSIASARMCAVSGGCFAIVIAGYPAAACRRVPWDQSDHVPDGIPVITIRYWSGRP